jgi:hypothetical protein
MIMPPAAVNEQELARWEDDGGAARADRRIGLPELYALWASISPGELRNGITGQRLREQYGDRLYHVTGVGWFVTAS